MKREQFEEFKKTYKVGTYVSACWSSQKKTLKGHKEDIVTKVSKGVVRLGIDFSHMKTVNRVANSLAYGEYMKGLEKFIIEYNENLYLRMYPSFSKTHKVKSMYFLNGEPTTKDYLITNGICSESMLKSSSENVDCFNIKLENLISL